MKKFLIAVCFFALFSVSAGYAQDLTSPRDKFEDFQAKVKAASFAEQSAAPTLGPATDVKEGDARPVPDGENAIEAAAYGGDPSAMLALAQMYHTGDGVPKDDIAAYRWASQAARFSKNDPDMVANAIKLRMTTGLALAHDQKEDLDKEVSTWSPVPVTKDGDDPFAGMIVAKSEIKAVTVYSNRAKITRVAEVDVPAGSHTLAFKDFPAGLLVDSLTASGTAQGAVKIGAVATKQVILNHLAVPREQELHDALASLQDEKNAIEAEKTALEAQETFLKNIGEQATLRNNENLAQIDLKPDQWIGAAQSIHMGLSDIYKAQAQQDMKMRIVDEEIDKTQRKLDQIGTGARSVFAVLLPIESEKAAKVALEIDYQMNAATWAPVYEARVSTAGKGDMKLAQFGTVRQQTGEDWTGVALTLSTAQPQRATILPSLNPMWINGYERRASTEEQNKSSVGSSFMPTPVGPAANMTLALPATPAAPAGDPLAEWRAKTEAKRVSMEQQAAPTPISFTPASIETGGFVSEYKIAGPANVPSDNSEIKLFVGNFDLETKVQVHVHPQFARAAYFVAHSKLKGDSPLLPGKVALFRDDAYVGESSLPLLRPSEEADLSFGIDDQVSVQHKLLKDEKKQAGVIAKDNILERDYVTELQNLHKTPIDVVVEETMPVSRNEKVKVDIDVDNTTAGYTTDVKNIKGLLEWDFTMASKEKKEIKLDWQVSWPSDYSVSGL